MPRMYTPAHLVNCSKNGRLALQFVHHAAALPSITAAVAVPSPVIETLCKPRAPIKCVAPFQSEGSDGPIITTPKAICGINERPATDADSRAPESRNSSRLWHGN